MSTDGKVPEMCNCSGKQYRSTFDKQEKENRKDFENSLIYTDNNRHTLQISYKL